MLRIQSKPREEKDDTWLHAIQCGTTVKHLGDTALCLGQADYVKAGDRIRSINGDTPPNNVRWVVYPIENGQIAKRWYIGTDIDRIAIEYFFGEVTDSSGTVVAIVQ